jgi:hypothetical protein
MPSAHRPSVVPGVPAELQDPRVGGNCRQRREVSNAELDAVPLTRHDFHGEWNYTLSPTEPE